MASFADLVQRLQPTRGQRGFTAKIDEGRVAAALMLAQDPRLSAATACERCRVPTFRSRAKALAKQIQQLDLQHVQIPSQWTASELAGAPQPQSHGKAHHTPPSQQSTAPLDTSSAKTPRLPLSKTELPVTATISLFSAADFPPLPSPTSKRTLPQPSVPVSPTLQHASPQPSKKPVDQGRHLLTPQDEAPAERARRKNANRCRDYRDRKTKAQAQAPAPAAPPSTRRRQVSRLPGICRGSKHALLPVFEQACLLAEAEAEDCDVEECGPDPYEERCAKVEQMQLQFEQQLEMRADVADFGWRFQACHVTRGHGDARLSELEALLSHDEWEPVDGRVALWHELRLLLESDGLLHSFLVAPADIEGTAEYWEPPPCKLCGSKLLPGRDGSFDFVAREFWCDWCAERETAEEERRWQRHQAMRRREEYARRMNEKKRCYTADPRHLRKSGAPPPALSSPPPERKPSTYHEVLWYSLGFRHDQNGWWDIHTKQRWDRCPFSTGALPEHL